MEWQFKVGVGMALVFGLLPYGVKDMPHAISWSGMAVGVLLIVWGLAPNHDRIPLWPTLLLTASVAGLIAGGVWFYESRNGEGASEGGGTPSLAQKVAAPLAEPASPLLAKNHGFNNEDNGVNFLNPNDIELAFTDNYQWPATKIEGDTPDEISRKTAEALVRLKSENKIPRMRIRHDINKMMATVIFKNKSKTTAKNLRLSVSANVPIEAKTQSFLQGTSYQIVGETKDLYPFGPLGEVMNCSISFTPIPGENALILNVTVVGENVHPSFYLIVVFYYKDASSVGGFTDLQGASSPTPATLAPPKRN